ncbi:hypothetical protein XENOCAPTIV_018226, partial [Xenoophorus captivus]
IEPSCSEWCSPMVSAFKKGCDHCIAAYLDDVVVFSSSWEEHVQHLSLVLGKIQEAGLTGNP